MSEEQQEIILNNCQKCGKEIDEFESSLYESICEYCSKRRMKIADEFRFADDVISKVIYSKISKSDLKLFQIIMYYKAKHDFFNEFEINQTELAKEYNFQQSNISRSLKHLVKAELLTKNLETGLYSFTMSKF